MKTKALMAILTMFILLPTVDSAKAQTKFIKYKKYLIPVSPCKPKVIISTDLRAPSEGEQDDRQSMVHYLASSYRFNTVGIISTPSGGLGDVGDVNAVVAEYYKDFASLSATGREYQQSITTVQGTQTSSVIPTYSSSHKGAKLIRDEALAIDSGACGRLYVLVWGALTDVAIALNSTSAATNAKVAKNIRVYSIGAGNITSGTGEQDIGMRDVPYEFIESEYLMEGSSNDLWFILSDTTFRGMVNNPSPAEQTTLKNMLAGSGCLGALLADTMTGGNPLKAGDTPSVLYLMNGNSAVPDSASWGGRYSRVISGSIKPYWSDSSDSGYGEASINPIGGAMTPDSIYGAWYGDLKDANGSGCG